MSLWSVLLVSSHMGHQADLCCTPASTDCADMLTGLSCRCWGDVLTTLSSLHLTNNSLIFVAHHSCAAGRTPRAPRGSCRLPAVDVNTRGPQLLGCFSSVSLVFLWAWNLAEARSRRQFCGILWSGMRVRWPHQCNCECMTIASMPVVLQCWRTSMFGTLSCHLILAIWRRQHRWNLSRLRIWCLYSVYDSQPCSRDVKTTVL